MRDFRIWLSVAGLLFAGRMLFPVVFAGWSSPVREEELQQVVYVCRESGESFLLRAKASPEKHPVTGRFTLMPGLYCQQCRTWRASPSLEVLQQNPSARLCPKDRTQMSLEGPAPDGVQQLK